MAVQLENKYARQWFEAARQANPGGTLLEALIKAKDTAQSMIDGAENIQKNEDFFSSSDEGFSNKVLDSMANLMLSGGMGDRISEYKKAKAELNSEIQRLSYEE